MKNNPENIPTVVFDWLEKSSFSSLDPTKQFIVLQHFSAEAYDELHQGLRDIKFLQEPAQSPGRETVKHTLLARFDELHPPRVMNLGSYMRPNLLWKAAAVFLVFSAGWFCRNLIQPAASYGNLALSRTDTVYITKEVASVPEKIYDTVYITENKAPAKTSRLKNSGSHAEFRPIPETFYETLSSLPVTLFDNPANVQRNNSMKDDSLLKKYTFIQL